MSGIRFVFAFFFAMGVVTPAFAKDKGGEDETGAYAVVENWPQPWSKESGDRTRLIRP